MASLKNIRETLETHRSAAPIEVEVVRVTPEVAEWLLAANAPGETNRPLSKAYVRELANELREGRYVPTHEGVAIDSQGALIDGQHRLAAIVESGASAELVVAWNVDPKAFSVINQGRRRTAGQILAMAGVSANATLLSQMARAILTVAEGEHKPSQTRIQEYSIDHRIELERYVPVARRYTAPVGGAFAWADSLGWIGVHAASIRLLEKNWDREGDPMRAFDRRAETFRQLGSGRAAQKARFDVALNALLAVDEGRELFSARSIKPDYPALVRTAEKRRSMAPAGAR